MATSERTSTPDLRVGDVWRIQDCRMGNLSIRLTAPIEPRADFFDAELVWGKPQYIGDKRNYPEEPGDRITFRYSFVTWVELVERKEDEEDGDATELPAAED